MSSLARLTGVSQPAPYRHFADREALFEAVATEGFEELAAGMVDANTGRSPIEALKATALAYVTFGEANIEIYRLMFASRLSPRAKPGSDFDQASGKALELLQTAMAAVSSLANVEDDAYLI